MFLFDGPSGLTIDGKWTLTDEFIFPIVGFANKADHPPVYFDMTGFTFTNAPILITAAHLTKLFDHFRPRERVLPDTHRQTVEDLVDNRLPAILTRDFENRKIGRLHLLGGMIHWGHMDIAVLPILGNFGPTPHIPILEEPEPGLSVMVQGYPKSNQKIIDGNFQVRIGLSNGHVIQSYPSGGYLDRWYPGISITANTAGGMSGGPVGTKENFRLIGVNSSSMTGADSYCAWLGKALDLHFNQPFRLRYQDGSEIDLGTSTLREIHSFGGTKVGQTHSLMPY
jgi:hypothetical protein